MPINDKQPNKSKFILAKLFGKRVNSIEKPTKTDKGCEVTGYHRKGILYITNFSEIPCQT